MGPKISTATWTASARSHPTESNEQFLIRKALEESHWTIEGKQGAAARLDIPSSTLRDRMQKYGIQKPARRI